MAVTPLQIANAYATFATNGDRYQPNIAPGNLPNRAPITPRAIAVANRRTLAVIPTIRPKMIQGINPIGVFRP